jgi:hypothetical protein
MQLEHIKPGQMYYHFKRDPEKGIEHGAYLVLGLGINTEDRNILYVVTKPLYFCDPRQPDELGKSFLIRPVEYFTDSIAREHYSGPRFWLITDEKTISALQQSELFRSHYLDA